MMKLLLITLLFTGCNISRNQKPMILDSPETQKTAAELDYKTVNEVVLQPSCVGCHSKGSEAGGVNLETYENVYKHAPQIKLEVAGGLMPPSKPLSSVQAKMLHDWIDAGAKEKPGDEIQNPSPVPTPLPEQPQPQPNPAPAPAPTPTPEPAPEPPPAEVTFTDVMNKVIKTNCLSCHAAATGNKGHVNLETYENVSANLSDLMEAVNEDRMPPKKGIPLTAVQKQMLVSWFTQGAKP
jgi:uncharacterized membrane protein